MSKPQTYKAYMQSIVDSLNDCQKEVEEVDSIIDRSKNSDDAESGFIIDPKPDYVEGECLYCPAKVTEEDEKATDEATYGNLWSPACPRCLIKYLNTKCFICDDFAERNDLLRCETCHRFTCGVQCHEDDECSSCAWGRCNKCNNVLAENESTPEEDHVKTCEDCRCKV